MIACPKCGSSMPEWAAFCQKCGSPMHPEGGHNQQGSRDSESGIMDDLRKQARIIGWSAGSVKNLPASVSTLDNLLLVSPEMTVLVMYTATSPTENEWENLVLAKYRMGADILDLVIEDRIKRSISAESIVLAMKSGIVINSLSETMAKLHQIQDSWDRDRIRDALLGVFGLTGDGQGRYSFTMKKSTDIGDAIGGFVRKVKDAVGKRNQP